MMQGNRADNGQQIPWTFETPQHPMGQSLFDTANFVFARLYLMNLLGNVNAQVLWKGTRGVFKKVMDIDIAASPGDVLLPAPEYSPATFGTVFGSCIPQVRAKRTENTRGPYLDCLSSAVEGDGEVDQKDRAFSLLFRFKGRAGVQVYRIEADDTPNTTEGKFPVSETGQHLLKGGDCPEFIAGTTPTYLLAEDTPRNALAAVQNNQLFASQDTPQNWLAGIVTPPNGTPPPDTSATILPDIYAAPPVNPFPAAAQPPVIPNPPYPTPGFVMLWAGPNTTASLTSPPPSLLYGLEPVPNSTQPPIPLNLPVQFLTGFGSAVTPGNNYFNRNGTAFDSFYYVGQAPFASQNEQFAAILYPSGAMAFYPLNNTAWPLQNSLFINNTPFQIRIQFDNGLTLILTPGQTSPISVVNDGTGGFVYQLDFWNGSAYVNQINNVVLIPAAPGRSFFIVTGTAQVAHSTDPVNGILLNQYSFYPEAGT